jgi:hypothetical protein
MGRILDGLERCTWLALVGLALGHRPYRVREALRAAGYPTRNGDDSVLVLQRYGHERVRRAMLDDPWLRELLDA